MNRFSFYFVNTLTALRIVGIPFIFLIDDEILRVLFADFLFITDFLDGFIARKFNVSSTLGAVLDLIADKALVIFILTVSTINGIVWWPLSVLIIVREIYSIVLRYNHYKSSKKLISASFAGKLKTAVTFISLNLVLLELPGRNVALIFVVILSYYSFLGYFKTSRGKA